MRSLVAGVALVAAGVRAKMSAILWALFSSQWGPGPQKGHFQGTLGAAAGRAEATV